MSLLWQECSSMGSLLPSASADFQKESARRRKAQPSRVGQGQGSWSQSRKATRSTAVVDQASMCNRSRYFLAPDDGAEATGRCDKYMFHRCARKKREVEVVILFERETLGLSARSMSSARSFANFGLTLVRTGCRLRL